MLTATHVAFSDESHQNIGQFRGVSLISLENKYYKVISDKLQSILDSKKVSEIKWGKIGGFRERIIGINFLIKSIEYAVKGLLRIDVLVWDISDSRHTIRNRDDMANLQRMYYHLFKNVLINRWPEDSIWVLYPDENTGMNWDTIEDFLDKVSTTIETHNDLFTKSRFKFRLKNEFNIEKIIPCDSKKEPFIQLADLYVGIAIYSRMGYAKYYHWLQSHSGQPTLFNEEMGDTIKLSRADKERCSLIYEFDRLCKDNKLGVSFGTFGGFRTLNPRNPINFWWYEPQHELDKAPLRHKH